MIKPETVICFAAGKWTSLTRGVQNFCIEIAKKYQVLYVSNPPKRSEIAHGDSLKWFPSVRKVNKRLFCLEWPWWALKIHKIKAIEDLMPHLRVKIITYTLRKINAGSIAFLYVTHPVGFPYLTFFQKEKKVYHVFDNYSHYVSYNKRLDEYENENLKNFDYIFYLSKELLKKRKRFNNKSYLLTDGVDFNLFSKARLKNTKVPNDIDKIYKPIIGFVGAISGKIDLELLLHIVNMKPEWFFLIVGPVLLSSMDSKTFQQLCAKNNVLATGYKPIEVLPSYLKLMDVMIMPYRLTGHVRWGNPLKTLEYFSTGKPVVSIYLRSLEEYSKLIYFANKPEQWIKQIEHALQENNTDKQLQRVTLASNNTWAHRVQDLYDIIAE